MKCKIFYHSHSVSLEKMVNKFLASDELIDVINIIQSTMQGAIVITIIYIPNKEREEKPKTA